ncbi:MAG: zinc transporter ZupT [Clostridiales bacterium]|jgi:ZIP family zinc transporter|nr:zinc transporter ZupT [Clostridiales bacterium]
MAYNKPIEWGDYLGDVSFALLLTLLAGLATGLGGLVVMFTKTTNKRFLCICLSFSAGVMLYISFVEILFKGFEVLGEELANGAGYIWGTAAFFAGIAAIALIDKFVPHDDHVTEELLEGHADSETKGLKRTGLMSALAVSIHNFPEGLVTFMAAMYDPALGIAIAIAIALHNIPEGIAMASPIYYATGSRAKAVGIATASGLTEPLGGIVAWLLLRNIFDDMGVVFGVSFAFVAGIMVFVAVHQLLPAAQKYGEHHMVMKWLFLGMGFIALSMVLISFI